MFDEVISAAVDTVVDVIKEHPMEFCGAGVVFFAGYEMGRSEELEKELIREQQKKTIYLK